MTNGMCGIDSKALPFATIGRIFGALCRRVRSPLQGSALRAMPTQGVALGYDRMPLRGGRIRMHGAFIFSASATVFSAKGAMDLSANGAACRSPGYGPGYRITAEPGALKGRPLAPTARPTAAKGNALEFV